MPGLAATRCLIALLILALAMPVLAQTKTLTPEEFTDAFARAVGQAPVLLPWGASVPVMAALDARGIPNVLTGFGLPDAAMHAPNERFPLAYLGLGMEAVRRSLVALGAVARV